MPKRPVLLLLGAALLAAAPAAAQTADTVWSELYLRDLAEARRIIAEDHPGPVDTLNPAFARQLGAAYADAVARAPLVRDYDSFAIALQMFGTRFQDAHLNVGGRRQAGAVREAGIYPRYVDRRLVVAHADGVYGARVHPGARIVDCDGEPALELFERRVLSWRGRDGIVADRYTWAPLLLVDYGPPTPAAPTACRFVSDGDTARVQLQWRSAPRADVSASVARASGFPEQTLSLRRVGDALWVELATFGVRGEAEIGAMNHVLDTLAAELRSGAPTALVVLDLRGNSGGSSSWGDRFAATLFGADWQQAARAWLSDGVYTEWRVSADNLRAIGELVRQVEERGDDATFLRVLRDSLTAAQARGEPLVLNPGSSARRTGVERPRPSDVPFRVVAVTSASCFSACLDFMDLLRLHPAVTHVGQPTGVDTDYMENWGWTLPSGAAGVGYPMKVYRNRRRANNEGYTPHVARDDIYDTRALEHWILSERARWTAR
ncbi:MAG TPA: hypothetical protein VF039_04970 [Longimicrobiales bacterium]